MLEIGVVEGIRGPGLPDHFCAEVADHPFHSGDDPRLVLNKDKQMVPVAQREGVPLFVHDPEVDEAPKLATL